LLCCCLTESISIRPTSIRQKPMNITKPFTTALLCAAVVHAQNVTHYYVDAFNGLDTNPGTQAQPFKSLTWAVSAQLVDVHIHVLPGTYSPSTTGDFIDPTTLAPSSISLSGHQNFTISGLHRDVCVLDFGTGDGPWGFVRIGSGCVDVEIRDLSMINAGVAPWGNGAISVDGGAQFVDIHNCYFAQTYSTLIVWSGYDVSFHDNVIVDTVPNAGAWPSVGVRVRTTGTSGGRTYIYNNTFFAIGQGISWSNDAGNPQQWIINNVVLDATANAFPNAVHAGTHIVFENNLAFGSGGSNYNSVIGPNGTAPVLAATNTELDPILVNPAAGDFSPTSGSPCIDTGAPSILPTMMNDYFGNNRATDSDENGSAIVDRGAIEATDLSLAVGGFALGQVATIAVQTPNPGTWAAGALFMSLGAGQLYLPSVGISGLDLANMASVTLMPGSQFLFAIPNNPALIDTRAYIQALGLKVVGGAVVFKVTGLSSHRL
jgi:hypothetical protein